MGSLDQCVSAGLADHIQDRDRDTCCLGILDLLPPGRVLFLDLRISTDVEKTTSVMLTWFAAYIMFLGFLSGLISIKGDLWYIWCVLIGLATIQTYIKME